MPSMLSWTNLADTAEGIAATREATGLGVRNLLTEPVMEVWRVPAVAAGTITDLDVTLAAPAVVRAIALFAPRDGYLPPGYTVRVLGSAVSLGASEALSVAAAPLALASGRGAWIHLAAADVTLRYLRLRFTAGAGDDYLQLGRLWLGPAFVSPRHPPMNSFSRGWLDAGAVERAGVSGVASAVRGATYRAPRWAFHLLSDAEADQLEDAAAAVGTTRQVVACARTTRGARELVLGRIAAPLSPQADGPMRYRCEISMVEDL